LCFFLFSFLGFGMIVEKKVVVETQASAGGRSGRSGKWDWRRPTTCLVLAFVSLLELISSVQHTAGALIDLNVFLEGRSVQRGAGKQRNKNCRLLFGVRPMT
jgi:hypothetical protein